MGIPITDQTVVKACGGCHRPDDKQQLSRISFRRTTPEGWERTITRMMALNGVKIDAPTARQVVKYLSNNLGLAPEEARPVRYEVERRLQDETMPKAIEGTCNACHSVGRILSQRRTKPEWELLIAMHRGYYPIIDRQTYRRMGPPPRGRDESGRPPDLRHPSEKAIDHLAEAQPLDDQGLGGVVGVDAPGAHRRHLGALGLGAGQGRRCSAASCSRRWPGRTDEFTSQITYTYARTRPAGDARRPGHRLHRLPVARPLHRRPAPRTRRCAR